MLRIAEIGPVINLLTRMYEPTSGKILLGSENLSELSLSEYRNMVSVVSLVDGIIPDRRYPMLRIAEIGPVT